MANPKKRYMRRGDSVKDGPKARAHRGARLTSPIYDSSRASFRNGSPKIRGWTRAK